MLRARPRLCLAQGFSAVVSGQVEAIEPLLDDAERAFAATGSQPLSRRPGRRGACWPTSPRGSHSCAPSSRVFAVTQRARSIGTGRPSPSWARVTSYLRTLVRANLAVADWLRGQLGQAERSLAEALAERRAAGEGYLATRVCHDLGQVQRAQGNLDAALATYRQALEIAGEVSSQPPHLGMAHVGLAEVLYERDELAAALDHATRGVTLCRQLAFTPPLAAGLAILARIRQAHGDAAAAIEAMGEAGQVELSPQVVALLNPVPSQRARLLLAQGDVTAAAQWAKAAGLSPDDEPDYPREPAYLVLARVLLAQDRPGPALTLLQRLLATAASQGRTGSVIEIQALRALALAARGDHASALGALAEALTPGLPARLRPGLCRRGRADARAAGPALRRPTGPASPSPWRSTPATWPRSCAPVVRRRRAAVRGEPPRRCRAWPSR